MNNETTLQHPTEFKINEIFKNTEYIIPIYQRDYSWSKDEIEQLLNDIKDSSGIYFVGSLIVDHIETNSYTVIDGQQRLTTLYLLLVYLKDLSITPNSLSFETREKSNKTLKYIFENRKLPCDEEIYNEDIVSGYKIIQNYFNTISEKDKEKFKSRLEQISIIRTLVPKEIDLNHYFEIMNTRGEQLEIHEIAKGKILSVIKDDKNKKLAAAIWDACSQMDRYIQMNFTQEIRNAFFSPSWNEFKLTKFDDLKNNYTTNDNLDLKLTLQGILDKLEENKGIINNNSSGNNNSDEDERFESIITFPNFLLIINEALKGTTNIDDINLDDKNFINNLQGHWASEDKALNFIYNLLKFRFLFDKYIVKREFAKNYKEDGRWSLQRLEMYKDGKSLKPTYKLTYDNTANDNKNAQLLTLQSALRVTYTSPKNMHWLSKALFELNKNENADLITILETYACTKVKESDYKNAIGFDVARIIFTYLDYILYRDRNKSKYFNPKDLVNFQFIFRNSIEHFYPQNDEINKLESKYLHCFGNLALITVSANSKFSNWPPKSKADKTDIINQSPKLILMKNLMVKNKQWTATEIQQHDKEMKDLLEQELKKYNL